ncbi:MAG: SDR family oxidoreductase [Verrucomicrobiae bacterium]|nr:SDR family oxidoreductase [Verrucomicrobiae bacterium]
MGKWTFDDIPDQSGRNAIVTGANSGIGFETAKALALKGANVTLACRSQAKGQEAVERIRGASASASVALELLDLADLPSVEAFAKRYKESHDRLDLLILNAGVMVPPASKTEQGYELQFGVNHLGHFALTGALLPLVNTTSGSRVVAVSSTAAQFGKMNFDDLQFEKRGYQAWPAYGQSKLANQLFVRELQRRVKAAGSSVLVTCAHPGWTATDLQRTSGLISFFNPVFAMQPPQGALPTLRAATDPDAKAGDYFGPGGLMQMRGYPVRVPMLKRAKKDDDAAKLWEVSEKLTGVRYPFA